MEQTKEYPNIIVYHTPESGRPPKTMPKANLEKYAELFESSIHDVVPADEHWKPSRAPRSNTPTPIKPPTTEKDVVMYLSRKGNKPESIANFLKIKVADVEKHLSL